ncbi:MAG: sensor domain-containing diguanylate cyclase [Acidobacteria bacterium]|nr:MAG: sensor domain-containing diguanylate cyclase [Acidobacteriota bacterium]
MVTMSMRAISPEKRKHLLWLQWLLILGVAYLLAFNPPAEQAKTVAVLVLVALTIILIAGLFVLPLKYLSDPRVIIVLVSLNIVLVSVAIYLTNKGNSDFYLFFFIILMMAAAAQNAKAFVIGTMITSGLYVLVVYRTGVFTFTEGFLLRIPFLFIVGLFFGYLVYVQKQEQQELEPMADPVSDLFEFGRVLVEAEDLQVLQSKIPKLINNILRSDACELAIIEGERITEQIFEGLEPQEPQQSSRLSISKSIHHETYQSDDTFIASDLSQDPQFAGKEDAHLYPYHSYMGRLLKSLGRPSTLIAVYRKDQEQWSKDDINKFQFLMDQTELGLQHAQAIKQLETQARTDELTGLANYAYFSERMDQEFARARRHNIPLSLMVVDMDHFKKINDESGHATGNELLQYLASVLLDTTRPMDLAGRCGGDEFVMLLPSTDIEGVGALSQRLIAEIKNHDSSDLPNFSISVGCSTFPENSITLAELLAHADEALYFAKSKGRGSAFHYSNISSPA